MPGKGEGGLSSHGDAATSVLCCAVGELWRVIVHEPPPIVIGLRGARLVAVVGCLQ
jgi:hypothetical protein